MAVALSNTIENLETYSLIWLDASVNQSSINRQAQQQLKTILHHLLTFEDDQECFHYIKNLSKFDRIILIASGRYGRQIVPKINHFQQIMSIYIYCMDKRANEQWSQHYNKVKSVVTHLDELFQKIQIDYFQQEDMKINEYLSIKISDDQDFIFSQLLIDCLIRMKSSSDEKNLFISFCQEYYQTNHTQLNILQEFLKTYSSEQSLEWYIRHICLSRLLNKALSIENIDLLYLFRFFIYDISYQLGEKHCLENLDVYRSQLMLKDDFKILKNSQEKFLSINSFLITNLNKDQTRSLLYSKNISNDLEKIFFHIKINSQLYHIKTFQFIPSNINEIIFMIGSIFRIEHIEYDKDQIWNIQLTLYSIQDEQLEFLFNKIKNKLGNGSTNLLQFSDILCQMGKLSQSKKYCCRYLNQLPDNHLDIPNCYYQLGMIAELEKDFLLSLKWYKKSMKIFQEINHFNLPEIYHHIANIYSKTNNYIKAIKFYEKSFNIWKNNFDENHSRLIKCLNNMGAVYDMKNEYSNSLECYQQALDIAKKFFQHKHPDIAMIYRNIANVYEFQDEFQQALHFYKKAMKIFCYLSPSMDVYINDIQTSIERISLKLKSKDEK